MSGLVTVRVLEVSRGGAAHPLPGSKKLLAVLSDDDPSMSLDIDEEGKQARCYDAGAHKSKGLFCLQLVESNPKHMALVLLPAPTMLAMDPVMGGLT